MAKLSQNIVTILFVGFLVAMLMMCGGVEGQEICHDVLPAPGNGQCDAQSCKDQCASKWNGVGLCVQSSANSFMCSCSWPCST